MDSGMANVEMTETWGTLPRPDGETIAYHTLRRKSPSQSPGVVFLSGFKSDMTSTKASHVAAWCKERGVDYTRFDYFGHGASSGMFVKGTIGRWKEDALAVLDHLTEGRQVLVGSSMGGWIALLTALSVPHRVAALVGIAAAPDFTERLIWQQMTEDQKHTLAREGVFHAPSCYGEDPYAITRELIEEGRRHLITDGHIPLSCPVRLLHGMQDADVPWHMTLELAEKITSSNLEVHLVKNAGHRMSDPGQLRLLEQAIAEFVRP